jgi:glyceraldehyde-3-phosphate dehydrogenase (NAD(P))
MTVRVAIQGYGTIGKRVADAVALQKDMTVVGVSKTRPSFEARMAVAKGFKLFLAAGAKREEFDAVHLPVAGTVGDMLAQADIVVDCAPDKVGKENARLYEAAKLPAIFQGGEKAEVAEVSFSAMANYDAARGKRRVRVVSCNTTGLARAASVLEPAYGIEHWEATLVRRAADPGEAKKGPINGIMPTFQLPSHHGPDVQTIYPKLPIATTAVVVPTTLMHVHVNHLRLARPPANADEVLGRFHHAHRFHIFEAWERADGTPQVMEYARDRGGARADLMENVLWQQGVRLDGADLYFFQAIHQESIVIPENVDAIRAMLGLAPDGPSSIALTDRALGIPAPA